MPVLIACPKCGQNFPVLNHESNVHFFCPHCEFAFMPAERKLGPPPIPNSSRDTWETESRYRIRPKTPSATHLCGIASLACAAIALVLGFAPIFWLLSIPVAIIGGVTGYIGYAIFAGKDRGMPLAGMVVNAVIVCGIAFLASRFR